MMPRSFIVLLFVLCGHQLPAQGDAPRIHQLQIGLGPSLYPGPDLIGLGGYVQYAYAFNDHLALAPLIMTINANERTNTGFQTNSSLVTAMALRLTPFPVAYDGGKIDVGLMYHRLNTSTGRYAQLEGSSFSLPTAIQKSRQHLFGTFTAVSLGIFNGPRMVGGLKIAALSSFQPGSTSVDLIHAGIFLGFRF